MSMKSLFCQISKVDEEKRTVTGIGASEALDGDGEIFDYASSKPFIEEWSADAVTRSQGKSFGNIREMHQLSAVGKLSEPVIFDDSQKLVILTAYISDDQAWKKCVDGTYTGFSIAGPVVGDKWSDPNTPGAKRFTCAPVEFSTCDLPCNPQAVFTAVKAGGITEQRKFKVATATETEPIVADKTAPTAQKSMYSISDLASVISSLRWTQDDLAYEAEYEGDGSPIPDKLKSLVTELCAVLVDLTREESSEMVATMKAAGAKVLAKSFAQKGAKKDPVAKCSKALESIGECMTKACKCQDMAKCMDKMASAHADATDAVGSMSTDDDSTAGKAASNVAAAVPPISQGASPGNGEDNMDEAQKASLVKAEKDSAEALEVAKRNEATLTGVVGALEKLTNLIAGEPVAAKAANSAAPPVAVVNKAGEVVSTSEKKSDQDVAKSILSAPRAVSTQELSTLAIGR